MTGPPSSQQGQQQQQPYLDRGGDRDIDRWSHIDQYGAHAGAGAAAGAGEGEYTPSQPSFDAVASSAVDSASAAIEGSSEPAGAAAAPARPQHNRYAEYPYPPRPASSHALADSRGFSNEQQQQQAAASSSGGYPYPTTATGSASNFYSPTNPVQLPLPPPGGLTAYSPTRPEVQHSHPPAYGSSSSSTTFPYGYGDYNNNNGLYQQANNGVGLYNHTLWTLYQSLYPAQSPALADPSYDPLRYQPIPAPAPARSGQTQLNSYFSSSSVPDRSASAQSATDSWEAIKADWAALLAGDPLPTMSRPTPTWADVEDLCNGLTNAGSRVTVDKVKVIIRGINNLTHGHLKLSGNKAMLISSVTSHLRMLAQNRAPEYFRVARLVGEAQGFSYPGSPAAAGAPAHAAGAAAAASSSAAGTSSSAAQGANNGYYPNTASNGYYGGGAAANGYGSTNGASSAAAAGPSSYASRPQDFNLSRSPVPPAGRSPTFGTAAVHQNGYGASSSSYTSNGRLQPPATNGSHHSAYSAPRPGYSSSNSHNHASSSSSQQIPTTWPAKLPPRPPGLQGQPAVPMNFKPSPFYKIVTAVSTVQTMQRAAQGDRGSVQATIYLQDDQRQKLREARSNKKAPQYQLRLFCTSSEHYNPNNTFGYAAARQGIPIEFPTACEAKVNDCPIPGSLKGIKKKPGTAPPANVTAAQYPDGHARVKQHAVKLEGPGDVNVVTLHYANTDRPYYMIVYLVEYTSTEDFAERIRTNKIRTKEEVIKSLQRQAEDPEIQATSQTISFRDPLAYVALKIPIRGLHCMHIQCFDAHTFLSMMETTPTWLCPSCNRPVNPEDLVLDGYTRDLMDQVPSSVETLIIETDGTWRSEDNKYGNSAKAVEARAAKAAAAAAAENNGRGASAAISIGTGGMSSKAGTPFDVKPDVSGLAHDGNNGRRHGKGRIPSEVIDLSDGDDNDNDRTPPRLLAPPPTARPAAAAAPAAASGKGGVIDLTLSDDEDEGDDDNSSSVALIQRTPRHGNGAASKRRVDSDWEDGPAPSSQRPRYD